MIRSILSTLVLAALGAATPAFADSMVNFDIAYGGNVYSFSLPTSPTVFTVGTDYFTVAGVEISENGGAPVAETVYFTNTVGYGDGGLAIFSGPYTFSLVNPNQSYPPLFTGPLNDPTFVPGVYQVEDQNHTSVKGTITIFTPEPGTLVLFGTGLLCLAGVIRRKLPA